MLTSEITQETIAFALEHLATLRSEIEPLLPVLKEQKNRAALELSKYENQLSDAEDAVRQVAMEYVRNTGDLNPHPSLTFRRSTKIMYDKEAVIGELVNNEVCDTIKMPDYMGRMDSNAVWEQIIFLLDKKRIGKYLNLSVTLDVRAFEKDLKDGQLGWVQYEEVPNPTIAIARLGDILIKKEVDARGES